MLKIIFIIFNKFIIIIRNRLVLFSQDKKWDQFDSKDSNITDKSVKSLDKYIIHLFFMIGDK